MTGIAEGLLISAAVSAATAGLTYALTPTQKIEGAREKDLLTATSGYGQPLSWCWGTVRLPGRRIFAGYKEEVEKKEKQGKGAKVESTTYSYYGYYATAFAEAKFRPFSDITRVWMNKKLVYNSRQADAVNVAGSILSSGQRFANQYLRFYLGQTAQEIDPLLNNIDSILNYSYGIPTNPAERDAYLRSYGIEPASVLKTPAYNRHVYYVAQRLPLEDYFGALPSDEIEAVASENCTVGQIFEDIFGLVYPDYGFDVAPISTPEFEVLGYQIDSIQSAENAIQNLQKTHFIDLIQTGSGFKFIPLNSPRDVLNLRIEDVGAHQGSKEKPYDFERIDPDPNTLPTKCIVNYIDPDLNYDRNTQESVMIVAQNQNDNILTLNFPEAMTASKAATLADRSLLFAWILGSKYKLKLPPAYLDLEPCDLIPNLFDDRGYPIKLTQTRIGANLILECEGVLHDVTPLLIERTLESGAITVGIANYTTTISVAGTVTAVRDREGNSYTEGTDYTIENGEITIVPSGTITEDTELDIVTNSTATPDDSELGQIVLPGDTELLILDLPLLENEHPDYSLYLAASGGANWTGASVYVSTDNSRYILATVFDSYSVHGSCISNFDGTTVDVIVNEAELESVSDNDLALGFNVAVIGEQIIQYKTATLINTNTYRLTDITAGLRGTETQPNAVNGDRFVLLKGVNAELDRITGEVADIGEIRYFKALSAGQILDEVDPIQFVGQGIAQRPYAPINIAATKDGVGNITVTWDRRDRHGVGMNNPPLSETAEEYRVAFLDSSNVEVSSQIVNQSSVIYSDQNQTADFGALQNSIKVSVAQISSSYGVGSYSPIAELTPPLVEPAPTIASFTPASALPGTTINIVGDNLAQVTDIYIGDVPQYNIAVTDNQNISFVLVSGTVSGVIQITTTGGTAESSNPLIVEAQPPNQKPNFPAPNPVTLPYTIQPTDDGTEIIVDGETGLILIPDDVTDPNGSNYFEPTWGCEITLENPGQIAIEKEDLAGTGDKTLGIKGNNVIDTDNQTVRLWHRGNNVWKIS
ncbi:MAG: phage tail protein [Cyanobacteria bacterium J06623_7]